MKDKMGEVSAAVLYAAVSSPLAVVRCIDVVAPVTMH